MLNRYTFFILKNFHASKSNVKNAGIIITNYYHVHQYKKTVKPTGYTFHNKLT